MNDVYYNPESFGLSVVGEVQWDEPCYDFDLTVVWTDGSLFYWADDSGCSCPSPFEDFVSLDHAGILRGSFHDMAEALNTRLAKTDDSDRTYAAPQVVELISRAMAL